MYGDKNSISKIHKGIRQNRLWSARLERSSGPRTKGVPTYNQRGRRSGPCLLWGGLDKSRHIVPTALLVRVQCFRKGLYKAAEGPSTRPVQGYNDFDQWPWPWSLTYFSKSLVLVITFEPEEVGPSYFTGAFLVTRIFYGSRMRPLSRFRVVALLRCAQVDNAITRQWPHPASILFNGYHTVLPCDLN